MPHIFRMKSQDDIRLGNTSFNQRIAHHFFCVIDLHPHLIVLDVKVKWAVVNVAMIINKWKVIQAACFNSSINSCQASRSSAAISSGGLPLKPKAIILSACR